MNVISQGTEQTTCLEYIPICSNESDFIVFIDSEPWWFLWLWNWLYWWQESLMIFWSGKFSKRKFWQILSLNNMSYMYLFFCSRWQSFDTLYVRCTVLSFLSILTQCEINLSMYSWHLYWRYCLWLLMNCQIIITQSHSSFF